MALEVPIEWTEYLCHSLTINLSLFLVFYGTAYVLLYSDNVVLIPGVVVLRNRFKDAIAPYKCQAGYPPSSLVWKEFRRSFVSVLILVAWDMFIELCLFRTGFVRVLYEGDGSQHQSPSEQHSLRSLYELTRTSEAFPMWRNWLVMIIWVILWSDFHFYSYHRMSHEVKWLYVNVHKIHHESINPDPWSGLSFHPLESVMYFSSLPLFLLLLPVTPSRRMYQLLRTILLLAPIGGHTGYSFGRIPEAPSSQHDAERLRTLSRWSSFAEHYLHHEKFNFNYGAGVLPHPYNWDTVLGTAYKPPPSRAEHESVTKKTK
eukprot:TRINITY_DN24758_c0_g1_i1.p1 TRINITY_DN24758_c0_g1~~TRINITY_DN24758_c0_g1_i1.p1  ORF type:complete len:316 (-),score=9.15 TRINITY_DN24758_c0_g1_i1:277-1224(-)